MLVIVTSAVSPLTMATVCDSGAVSVYPARKAESVTSLTVQVEPALTSSECSEVFPPFTIRKPVVLSVQL